MPRAVQPSPRDGSTLLSLMQIFFSDPIMKARRFWRTELSEGISLADFESRFPKGSEGYEHFINLASFWETVGSLMQKGLVNEDLAFDTFLDNPPWKKAAKINQLAVAHGNRTHRGRLAAPATGFEGAAQVGPAPSELRRLNRLLRSMCRSCAAALLGGRDLRIEQRDGVGLHLRSHLRVPHGHGDDRVPQELLDRWQRYALHDEVAGERVAEGVPAEVR